MCLVGAGGDGDAIGTGVQQQIAVAGQQSFVTVAHGSGGEGNDNDGWNSGVARQQQLDLKHNGGVVETSGAPGGSSGGDDGDGSGPFSRNVFGGDGGAVYGGFLRVAACLFHHPQPLLSDAVRNLQPFREPPPGFYDLSWGHRCCHPWRLFRGLRLQRRQPHSWERHLILGDCKCMPVGFYGDLDLDLHCEQDVRVTLTNVAAVPGLAFDIMSFNRMQERREIILNRAEASMLGWRVRF